MKLWSASIARKAREEGGAALVMGLGILMTMTVMLTGTLEVTSASGRSASYSNAKQNAYALAEAGLNNAVSVLEGNYPGTVQYPGDPNLLTPSKTTQYPGGSVTWGGTLQQVTGKGWAWQWKLTSTSSVKNPTGPASAPASRTVTAVVPVVMPQTQPVGDTSILNWIFALKDATFTNQVTIASPLYAGNNLTLSNQASISGAARKVAVGNLLSMPQKADGIGSSSSRIGQAYVGGGCQYWNNLSHNPCQWDTDNVWADPAHRAAAIPAGLITLPTLTCCSLGSGTLPPSTMGFWYINSSPGPNAPCDPSTKTGTPPTFDTGDNTINNSATPTAAFNLTPSSGSYRCQTLGSDGQIIGELSWNASTMVLTIKGTVFIDGSATIDNPPGGYSGHPVFRYSGSGTIYLSGTFAVKSTIICAVTSGSDCNFTPNAWDPNTSALIVVADGDGADGGVEAQGNVVRAGDGIELVSASFQGALVANKNVQIDTTSEEQGPMISVYNSVYSGQTGTLTFPAVNLAPTGADGVTAPIPPGNLLPAQQFGG